MARLTKKQKEAHAKLDSTKSLDLNAACFNQGNY